MALSKAVQDKIRVMRLASKNLPLNDFGLPEGIYRPDLLPASLDDVESAELKATEVSDTASFNDEYTSEDEFGGGSGEGEEGEEGTPYLLGGLPASEDGLSLKSTSPQPLFPEEDEGLHDGSSHRGGLAPLDVAPLESRTPTHSSDNDPATSGHGRRLDRHVLAAAYVELSFDEGFPTLPDGRPFWERLEFESMEAFECFKAYLNQGRVGARQLFDLHRFNNLHQRRIQEDEQAFEERREMFEGIQDSGRLLTNQHTYDPSMLSVAMGFEIPSEEALQEYFHLNYWHYRARAYDMFRITAARKAQAERALVLDDEQMFRSTRLMNRLWMHMDTEDFFEELTPMAAINLLKTLAQLQRVAAGKSANGPSGAEKQGNSNTSLETMLRQISEGFYNPANESHESAANRQVRDILTSDPDLLDKAQELIVQFTMTARSKNGNTNEHQSSRPLNRGSLGPLIDGKATKVG